MLGTVLGIASAGAWGAVKPLDSRPTDDPLNGEAQAVRSEVMQIHALALNRGGG